ncbi:Nuclear fusion defective 6 protein [Thalictrum thalictroides]|uniref:Nuclear fusion defective 6 protein n=1 Tax=Thalictrum thalictroides TaxID=46969 RepID=A0A7J6X8Y2_THATH|nr:Nuclear fusion defective 6 protein [Thalictrum thalictroides]
MAASIVRRALKSSSFSAKSTILTCSTTKPSVSSASNVAKFSGFTSVKPKSIRISRHKLSFSSRLPVELGAAQSLMPLHSATASALLTSMLSSKVGSWGWLSEGISSFPVVISLITYMKVCLRFYSLRITAETYF